VTARTAARTVLDLRIPGTLSTALSAGRNRVVMVGALLVRHEPASAAFVRRQLACDLAAYDLAPDAVDDAVLVASELVGNAVRHTTASAVGTLNVTWDVDATGVWVCVGDSSAAPPRARIANAEDTTGRGLTIVDAVSDGWGVTQQAQGKQVWAHVPARRRDAAD
jgi:serine/threonine-protein kinase RsbW